MPISDPEKKRAYNRAYYLANKEKWRAANTEERRAYNRAYNEAHPDRKRTPVDKKERNRKKRERYASDSEYREYCNRKARESHKRNPIQHLLRKYKITAEHLELLTGQGCAICGASFDAANVRRVIDHDHATGATRGVLCQSCNLGLGHFRDDPIALANAIDYLMVGGRL